MTHIVLDGGKYTVSYNRDGLMRADRHGEPWRDLTGDKLVLALVHRIEELEAHKTALEISLEGERKARAAAATPQPAAQ